MEKNIDYYREMIYQEIKSKYPRWTLIIEYATIIRDIEYPNDDSHLLEMSGLKEFVDTEIKHESPKIENDDDFWK